MEVIKIRIKVYKGTNTIGGAITEISSSKGTIICDFGSDLDEVIRLPEIDGLTTGKPRVDAVFIRTSVIKTIIGRINEVLPEIPVYFSNISKRIIERVFCFSKTKGKFTRETTDLKDGVPVIIKNFKVTPYVIDHSCYNSYMLLIEVENKKILFTSDFRNTGYKGKIFTKTLKRIGKVNICISERDTIQ